MIITTAVTPLMPLPRRPAHNKISYWHGYRHWSPGWALRRLYRHFIVITDEIRQFYRHIESFAATPPRRLLRLGLRRLISLRAVCASDALRIIPPSYYTLYAYALPPCAHCYHILRHVRGYQYAPEPNTVFLMPLMPHACFYAATRLSHYQLKVTQDATPPLPPDWYTRQRDTAAATPLGLHSRHRAQFHAMVIGQAHYCLPPECACQPVISQPGYAIIGSRRDAAPPAYAPARHIFIIKCRHSAFVRHARRRSLPLPSRILACHARHC